MGGTYYDLLGVTEDASAVEIERAYREKLKEMHPDVSDSRNASERTKRLIEAKETLTDPSERARYDRLGHATYVGTDTADPVGTETDADGTARAGRTATGNRHDGSRQRAGERRGEGQRGATGSGGTTATRTKNVGSGAAWTRTNESQRTGARTADGAWRGWTSDGAYTVDRGMDALRFGGIFRSQHALVLFGTTFLVYPVLLFGALSTRFPLAINLFVAACIVFVIAFLQSVPEVGMVVFGGWTLLLPPLLFLGLGVNILSLQGLLALTAVVFPFGLSALTRIAIRPVTAG